MEKCRRCGCTLILAAQALYSLKEQMSPAMAGIPTERTIELGTDAALTSVTNVEEVCNVNLSEVKEQINLARRDWKQGPKWVHDAWERASEAASKLEMAFCKTRVGEE